MHTANNIQDNGTRLRLAMADMHGKMEILLKAVL